MIDTNELRRLAQAALAGPDGISLNWIKPLQGFQQKASPAAVIELLDRLKAAESEALEEARLNGMGSEREAALMAKLEAVKKERDEFKRACFAHISDNALLQAKIEAMEKQEPAYWGPKHAIKGCSTTVIVGKFPVNPTDAPLYALPGAKGE